MRFASLHYGRFPRSNAIVEDYKSRSAFSNVETRFNIPHKTRL